MTKDEAIEWAGGVNALGRQLGISGSAVAQWDEVPELQQYRLWRMSAGKLTIDPKYEGNTTTTTEK